MKVLYLLDSLNRGGAETLSLDVCRNARANDLDLTLAATGGGALETDFETSGVAFIRLQRRLPIDFRIVASLRRIIKERQIEIVHTHQAVEAVHAYLAVRGTKTRLVLSHHGFIADRKNLLTLRFLIPRVSMNVVVSRALLGWYKAENNLKFPEQTTKILYNGVDEKRLANADENLKRELGLAANDLLIGMVANFYRDPRKDQMTVCRALPRIFAEHPNAFCVFVGGTEAGAENKFDECVNFCRANRIERRVFFLGSRSDAARISAALDVFVLSSLQEGFGIVVVEAMLSKVPCIVSSIEPLLEVSRDGKYAETFPVGSDEILSRKIIKLLEDKKRREDLANFAYEFAADNYSIEAHLRELKKLYRSIL